MIAAHRLFDRLLSTRLMLIEGKVSAWRRRASISSRGDKIRPGDEPHVARLAEELAAIGRWSSPTRHSHASTQSAHDPSEKRHGKARERALKARVDAVELVSKVRDQSVYSDDEPSEGRRRGVLIGGQDPSVIRSQTPSHPGGVE